MMISSAAPGTGEPPQVAGLFQFPVTEAVLVAACAGNTGKAAKNARTIKSANEAFEISCLRIFHLLGFMDVTIFSKMFLEYKIKEILIYYIVTYKIIQ
jgi:hypothetical protein